MSEEYERMMELREPLLRIADAVEQIAAREERRDVAAVYGGSIERLERILWELYPDTCRRAGIDFGRSEPKPPA